MKLKVLRILMALLAAAEVAAVIARWYIGNGGYSSRGNWLIPIILGLGLVLKALDGQHRCPHCKKHLDYKKHSCCPHCKEPLDV